MSDIALNAVTRSSLLLLQRTADVRAEALARLSTGLRVRQPSDAPAAFFEARGANARVRDLLQAKDQIGQAVSAVETAQLGANAIEDLTGQLKGLALSVRGASAEERQIAAQQFDAIRRQITTLANDISFNGVALLGGIPDSLSVNLDGASADELTIDGQASDATSLGVGRAFAYGSFATDTDIQNAVADLDAAISAVRRLTAGFANDVGVLRTRENFNQALSNTLDAGAAKLVDADLNAEAARTLATQLRQQLGADVLRISNNSQSVLASLI